MAVPLPPLRLLLTFASVARTGSIQIAAAELNVTQPAVSQAVKQLEAQIGVRLLDRSRRPARPTAAGQTLATAISDGLDRIVEAVDEVRRKENHSAQAVTIACSVGVATYWLMPRLAPFYEAHPDISVNVITTQLGAPDLSPGIDLAIRYGHGRWSDGDVKPLFDEVIEPLCDPSLRAQFDGPVPLDKVSLLHVQSPEASWVSWADYARRTGQTLTNQRALNFTNYVQATQAALAGRGVILGWRSITGALADGGQLVSAGLATLQPDDGFFLVARAKRVGRAADIFRDWLLSST